LPNAATTGMEESENRHVKNRVGMETNVSVAMETEIYFDQIFCCYPDSFDFGEMYGDRELNDRGI
jgi:hypothetical protein